MPNDQPDPTCEWCHYPICEGWYYCPKCGEEILDKGRDVDLPTADDVRGILKPADIGARSFTIGETLMAEYVLKFKNREISKGDLSFVFHDAVARGAISAVTPSRRGFRYTRLLIDLNSNYEICPRAAD